MSAVIINPKLTIGNDPVAEALYETLHKELDEYVNVCSLKSATHFQTTTLQSDDVIVIFNKENEEYSENILILLGEALDLGCFVVPVSVYENTRSPASIISRFQNFDVVEQLRQRQLTITNMDTIAFALTRLVISHIQPTLSVEKMDLFISYRRSDGETLAAEFFNEFRKRASEVEVFRDLISISVGQEAQAEIERNLKHSDAVVLIDTPMCGESFWIKKEITIALGLNIPIVWIRVGLAEGRVEIEPRPADKAHFTYDNLKIIDLHNNPNIVDEIIHKAFQISRTNAGNVVDHLNRLRRMAKIGNIELTEINKKNMVYQVKIPRRNKDFQYYQRPVTHLVQFFGRTLKASDKSQFHPLITELGYEKHPNLGYHFDSGLMLCLNTPTKPEQDFEQLCEDSIDEYITGLQKYLFTNQTKTKGKGVIISGAFPDFEPELQQNLINAVFAFTKAILDKGGVVIFGSHPTFQHLMLDLAKRQRPTDYVDALHMYISKYFVTQATINEFATQATVYAIDDINHDRAQSLTAMRKSMIEDAEAAGIILLGGKQHTHIKPGIDEEFELAQQRGLPIFVVGSVGGRSSEIAQNMIKTGTKPINSLSEDQNYKLFTSLDYRTMADEVMESLGF